MVYYTQIQQVPGKNSLRSKDFDVKAQLLAVFGDVAYQARAISFGGVVLYPSGRRLGLSGLTEIQVQISKCDRVVLLKGITVLPSLIKKKPLGIKLFRHWLKRKHDAVGSVRSIYRKCFPVAVRKAAFSSEGRVVSRDKTTSEVTSPVHPLTSEVGIQCGGEARSFPWYRPCAQVSVHSPERSPFRDMSGDRPYILRTVVRLPIVEQFGQGQRWNVASIRSTLSGDSRLPNLIGKICLLQLLLDNIAWRTGHLSLKSSEQVLDLIDKSYNTYKNEDVDLLFRLVGETPVLVSLDYIHDLQPNESWSVDASNTSVDWIALHDSLCQMVRARLKKSVS